MHWALVSCRRPNTDPSTPANPGKASAANTYAASATPSRLSGQRGAAGLSAPLARRQTKTSTSSNTSCNKPVREPDAALAAPSSAPSPSKSQAGARDACGPRCCAHHASVHTPMVHSDANWLRWRKLPNACPSPG